MALLVGAASIGILVLLPQPLLRLPGVLALGHGLGFARIAFVEAESKIWLVLIFFLDPKAWLQNVHCLCLLLTDSSFRRRLLPGLLGCQSLLSLISWLFGGDGHFVLNFKAFVGLIRVNGLFHQILLIVQALLIWLHFERLLALGSLFVALECRCFEVRFLRRLIRRSRCDRFLIEIKPVGRSIGDFLVLAGFSQVSC